MMSKSGNSILLITLVAVLALAAGIFMRSNNQAVETPQIEKIVVLPTNKPLMNINFTDHQGKPFNNNQFKGHWSIVFFGFTHCPDICPTTMHTLKQVKSRLKSADKWGNYQVVMITVDPNRDTVEKLSSYVPFFDPEFIGIRGDIETTTNFAKQLGILFVSRPADENGNYDVDHSAALILINPRGEMAGVIPAPHEETEISSALQHLADFYAADHAKPDGVRELNETTKSSANEESEDDTTSELVGLKKLTGKNAWIRPAPSSAESMAAYMELVNHSDTPITIVSVESPLFDMAMIHDSVVENGLSGMRHLDELIIPANDSFVLAPAATHLMLIGPETIPSSGDLVEITIVTSDDQEIILSVEVRDQPLID